MPASVRIALDAMGGDFGPSVIVPGASLALTRRPDAEYIFVGDSAQISPLLERDAKLAARSRVIHAATAVRMDEKPSQALRRGRRTSSMWLALETIKKGEADCVVSAGNTGALMAMAKFALRTMAQIDRPALAAIWPTVKGESIVLDVGASIGADAQHFVELAVMGAAMANIVFGLDRPTVGLLNVGVEEIKGLDEVKAAHRMLREADLQTFDYRGFVEGNDLGRGAVDVFVTEGFTGNIALKTAEGTAKQIAAYLRAALSQDLMSRIGYFLARRAFRALRDKLDPRNQNGAVFLGLDGIVIKSHGGADAVGFAGAIEIGYEMARHALLEKIRQPLSVLQGERLASPGLRRETQGARDAL
jgi:phosphate acyltransferase